MVLNDLRGYLQLANGLTEVTRQRAVAAARQLIDQGGGDAGHVARQVQSIAEDLLATSRTNRDLLIGMVRSEVDRTVARLGLVSADELAAMAKLVERLQAQVNAGAPGEPKTAAAKPAAKKVPAKKVPAKKVPAKKVPAKKVPAKKVAAKKVAAKKVAVKKSSGGKV